MSYLRGNEEQKRKMEMPESAFARQVLANVGGSTVYIQPKKVKKLLDMDKIE